MKYLVIILASLMCSIGYGQDLGSIINKYESYQKHQRLDLKDKWPALTAESDAEKKAYFQNMLSELEQVDRLAFDLQDHINAELLQLIAEDNIASVEHLTRFIPLSAEGGFITHMMYQARGKKLKDTAAIRRYKSKLDDTPRYIDQQIYNLKQGLSKGITVPKLVVKNCIAILAKAREADELFLTQVLPDDHGYDEAPLKAALDKLYYYLEHEYLTSTREAIGIRENTNGKSYYEQRVRYYTTLDMTPDEVFEIGQKEVARIRAEMQVIIDSLDFDGSFEDFIAFLRTDEQFYAKTPQQLLERASWLGMKAQEILPRYFGKLPQLPLTVKPVPAEIAPTYTTGRYSGGSMDGQRAGQYWVNTYNLSSRPLYVLPALTLHEAVPGHHLQISLAQELYNIPDFRRSYYLSAFGEGWGLYSEYLGKEAGIYQSLYEDFGRLTYEMWRACRLVVDPGMHYKGWTRDQAVEFMRSNSALSLHNINTEIDRYIGWPGQAVSYKIGEIHIKNLRSMAEERLGERFDIRAFHDKLLENGSVPLSTLTNIIEDWILQSSY